MPSPADALSEHTDHPAAWIGDQLTAREDWDQRLGAADIDEIDRALAGVADPDYERLSREGFPLPSLAARRATVKETLETGAGVVRLRGLDVNCTPSIPAGPMRR